MARNDAEIREELHVLLDDFCSEFNVSLSLRSQSGKTLLTSSNFAQPAFCLKCKKWLTGPGVCDAQVQRMRHLAEDRLDAIVYTCCTGLRCCVTPFVDSRQVVVTATIFGFRFDDKPSTAAMRDWRAHSDSAEALSKDFCALPQFSAAMEKRMVRLFKVIADHAIAHGLIGLPRSHLFGLILEYIRTHVASSIIPINEVADNVHKSVSTVSHIVKKEAGISFKRLVIEQKLSAAESLLLNDTTRSIRDVAESLGFSDQFYFSRIYRKCRGYPPKDYIRHRIG
jgi:AraC-like DNA-binding protein